MRKQKKDRHAPTPERAPGWPQGRDDVVNKYGTYEVQATCGMENEFPMIAQGGGVGKSAPEALKKTGENQNRSVRQ